MVIGPSLIPERLIAAVEDVRVVAEPLKADIDRERDCRRQLSMPCGKNVYWPFGCRPTMAALI
jgi:hypothetical protein